MPRKRANDAEIKGPDGRPLSLKNIRLNSLLRSGANGTVVLGFDTVLLREIVIKFWNIQRPGDNRDKARQALREARKLAALDHKGIVRVYSCGMTQGVVYLVMEHLKGVTLADALTDPTLTVRDRRKYWEQLFLAIGHAYTNSIYHGDLHLGNVMVVDHSIKIIDFGTSLFARSMSDARRRDRTLLCRLFLRLLPEARSLYAECHWRSNNPEIALLTCNMVSAVDEELRDLQRLFVPLEKPRPFAILQHLFSIAISISEVPSLRLATVMKRIQATGVAESQLRYFAHECLTVATMMDGDIDEVDRATTVRPSIADYVKEHALLQDRRAIKLEEVLTEGYARLSAYL